MAHRCHPRPPPPSFMANPQAPLLPIYIYMYILGLLLLSCVHGSFYCGDLSKCFWVGIFLCFYKVFCCLYFVMWWIEFACDKSFSRRPSPRRRRHVSPRYPCANEAAVAAAAAASAKWSRAFRRLQQWRTVMQAFPFRCCTWIGCRRDGGSCLADTP